jgi:hypothetical protein
MPQVEANAARIKHVVLDRCFALDRHARVTSPCVTSPFQCQWDTTGQRRQQG